MSNQSAFKTHFLSKLCYHILSYWSAVVWLANNIQQALLLLLQLLLLSFVCIFYRRQLNAKKKMVAKHEYVKFAKLYTYGNAWLSAIFQSQITTLMDVHFPYLIFNFLCFC